MGLCSEQTDGSIRIRPRTIRAVYGLGEFDLTKRTRVLLGALLTTAMAVAAFVSLDIMDGWIGDWAGPVWVIGAFVFPFTCGLVWGASAQGTPGRVAGAIIGAAMVLLPGIGYALLRDADLSELKLPLLWAIFTPLAMIQGAMSLPVGALGRKRRSA
jgi:hypothetical protein